MINNNKLCQKCHAFPFFYSLKRTAAVNRSPVRMTTPPPPKMPLNHHKNAAWYRDRDPKASRISPIRAPQDATVGTFPQALL